MTASPPPAAPLPRVLRSAASMIAAAALLAACSSSSPTGSGGSSSNSGAASSTSVANTSASSSTAPTTGDTSAVAIGGSGDSSFCGLARQEQANSAKEVDAYAGASPAKLEKLEKTTLAELPVFAAQAPSAIRPYVETLVTADQKLFKVLEAAKFDFRKINPSALSSLQSPAFTKASNTIEQYLTKVCKIPSSVPSS